MSNISENNYFSTKGMSMDVFVCRGMRDEIDFIPLTLPTMLLFKTFHIRTSLESQAGF